jgi:hypothetical protein
MQEQTPSSTCWKWLASLTMMALPAIFEMNFVEVWQSSQTCRFFLSQRGEPGVVLMSPNAIASFSLWWHKWNTFFSSSTSCRTNFVQGIYQHRACMSLNNLCSSAWISIIWGWSWFSTTNICNSLITSIQVWPSCFFTPFSCLCCSTFSSQYWPHPT